MPTNSNTSAAMTTQSAAVFSLASNVDWAANSGVRAKCLQSPLWENDPSALGLARRAITAFEPRDVEDEYKRFALDSIATFPQALAFFGLAGGQVYSLVALDERDTTLPTGDQELYLTVRRWATVACIILLSLGGILSVGIIFADYLRRRCGSRVPKSVRAKSMRSHYALQTCVPYLWSITALAYLVFMASAHGRCFPEAAVDASVNESSACERSFQTVYATLLGFGIFFIESPFGAAISCCLLFTAQVLLEAVVFPRWGTITIVTRVLAAVGFSVVLLVLSVIRAVANRTQFRDLLRSHVSRQDELEARTRAANLVSSVLPRSLVRRAAQHILHEPPQLWDVEEIATVCVTEASDFNAFCAATRDVQACCAVHHLFTLFDTAAAVFGVERATTLGDAFVCTAGLVSRSSKVGHALRFALWQLRLPETNVMPLRSAIVTGRLEGGIAGTVTQTNLHKSSSLRYVVGGDALDRALQVIKHASADELLMCDASMAELQALDCDVLRPPYAVVSRSALPNFTKIESLQPRSLNASRSTAMLDEFEADDELEADLADIAVANAGLMEESEVMTALPGKAKTGYALWLASFSNPETEAAYRQTARQVATRMQSVGLGLYFFMMATTAIVVAIEGSLDKYLATETAVPLLALLTFFLIGVVIAVVNWIRAPTLLPFQWSSALMFVTAFSFMTFLALCRWDSIVRNDPLYAAELCVIFLTTFAFSTVSWPLAFVVILVGIIAPVVYILINYAQSYATAASCVVGLFVAIVDVNRRCRRTFASIRCAELGQKAAADASARLQELADGLVPRHVVERGFARLPNPFDKSHHIAPDSRVEQLHTTCSKSWFMDVVDCFDEFIVASVNVIPSGGAPHDLRQLWKAVGEAVNNGGPNKIIRLVSVLGDHFLVAGPFPEAEADGLVVKSTRPLMQASQDEVFADRSSGGTRPVSRNTASSRGEKLQQGERHYRSTLPKLHEAAVQVATMLEALAKMTTFSTLKDTRIVAGVAAEEAVGGLVGNGTMRYKIMGVAVRHALALRCGAEAVANEHILRHVVPVAGNHVVVMNDRMSTLLLGAKFDENRVVPIERPWAVRGLPFRRHHFLALLTPQDIRRMTPEFNVNSLSSRSRFGVLAFTDQASANSAMRMDSHHMMAPSPLGEEIGQCSLTQSQDPPVDPIGQIELVLVDSGRSTPNPAGETTNSAPPPSPPSAEPNRAAAAVVAAPSVDVVHPDTNDTPLAGS